MRAKTTKTKVVRKTKVEPHRLLDKSLYLKPIAHRGLHDARRGLIENTAPAFEAAIAKGYGIECDLQPAVDGTPMVFHDAKLDRLVEAARGPVASYTPKALRALPYRGQETTILSFADFLKLVDGRVPLLVEVKSEGKKAPREFITKIANTARSYRGPIALMSFNPETVAALARAAPKIPRGLVLGRQQVLKSWLARAGRAAQGTALTRLLDEASSKVSFFAVESSILKGAAHWRKQGGHDVGLFSWTIRTKKQRAIAARYADAPIFEGYEA